MEPTPIQFLGVEQGNKLYIKRDDLIPYSFGGNKARKGFLFFNEIDKGNYDCVVTYGSSHSNHCRVIANMAAARKIPCILIGPEEVSDATFNSSFMHLFGAEMIAVPVNEVHEWIEATLIKLRATGKKPYFIPGGGHGNIGTEAYVQCYKEICAYEAKHDTWFDYIFLASGTGTTQAGLVCGQIKNQDCRKIVGISIARKNPRGSNVIIESIREYLPGVNEAEAREKTIFVDDYRGDGYGTENFETEKTIVAVMTQYGIPMDSTYTGKAFLGMKKYLYREGIKDKNLLFIHTGGTPLFFNDMKRIEEKINKVNYLQ